ncbi:integral membrane protein [Stemphylium lycopersici]|nr:integral membrane protein [Stemphylium lycopersici]
MKGYSQSSYTESLVARAGGLHPPSEVIYSWPRPNYVDPEERGWAAPIVLIIFLGITFLVYVARMWARFSISKNTGLDDILISLAMLPLFGLTIALAIELNYMVSTTLIKVSILCFYRRITGRLTNQFVYWVYGTIAFCIIYGIVFTFVIIFTCTPVEGFWRFFDVAWRLQNDLKCRNEGALIVACAAISSVQDFVICLLPILLIWNLQISKRQKFGLCGVFVTYDITWIAYYGWVWTTLEAQLAVICASAPSLKVFLNRYFAQYTTRAGYSGVSRGKTPNLSSKAPSNAFFSKKSQSSIQQSQMGGDMLHEEVPLEGIQINRKLDVKVEERDDCSQKSFASTGNLTTVPQSHQGWRERADWAEGCRTVCAAFRPGSRGTSASRNPDDIEAGRPF